MIRANLSSAFRRTGAKPLLSIAGLILALSTSGCGALNTLEAAVAYEKTNAGYMTTETMVVTAAPVKETAMKGADKFALMSLFSHLTYLKHLAEKERNVEDCSQHIAGHPINEIDTRGPDANGAWRRWAGESGCFSGSGLYYETYVFGKAGKFSEAVIAFRGTENYGAQIPEDWGTDFSAALGFDPKEYQEARSQILRAINNLRAENKEVKIYLTGHSLGGGLAQQSAYTMTKEDVSSTYIFNTSPVSNWSYLYSVKGLIRNDDPEIFRIQERGEGLAIPRWVSTRVNFRRFGRSDYEFNFTKGNPVSEHTMAILACNFASRILATGKEAKHHFTPDMARKLLTYPINTAGSGETLCPAGVWPEKNRPSIVKAG